ncbi:MAG: glycosyltransferase, partial [Myxococcales bacterium]|nr:glycosyltransferase [Myxococcales bacterium]
MPLPSNILLLGSSLTALGGGIEVHDREVVEAIAAHWPAVRLTAVLACEPVLARPSLLRGEARSRLVVDGAPANVAPLRRKASFVAAALRAALRSRPDLVVCGHVNYAALAWAIARARGAPWVAMVHGIEAWAPSHLAALALRHADRVLSVSRYTAAKVGESCGVDP